MFKHTVNFYVDGPTTETTWGVRKSESRMLSEDGPTLSEWGSTVARFTGENAEALAREYAEFKAKTSQASDLTEKTIVVNSKLPSVDQTLRFFQSRHLDGTIARKIIDNVSEDDEICGVQGSNRYRFETMSRALEWLQNRIFPEYGSSSSRGAARL